MNTPLILGLGRVHVYQVKEERGVSGGIWKTSKKDALGRTSAKKVGEGLIQWWLLGPKKDAVTPADIQGRRLQKVSIEAARHFWRFQKGKGENSVTPEF